MTWNLFWPNFRGCWEVADNSPSCPPKTLIKILFFRHFWLTFLGKIEAKNSILLHPTLKQAPPTGMGWWKLDRSSTQRKKNENFVPFSKLEKKKNSITPEALFIDFFSRFFAAFWTFSCARQQTAQVDSNDTDIGPLECCEDLFTRNEMIIEFSPLPFGLVAPIWTRKQQKFQKNVELRAFLKVLSQFFRVSCLFTALTGKFVPSQDFHTFYEASYTLLKAPSVDFMQILLCKRLSGQVLSLPHLLWPF